MNLYSSCVIQNHPSSSMKTCHMSHGTPIPHGLTCLLLVGSRSNCCVLPDHGSMAASVHEQLSEVHRLLLIAAPAVQHGTPEQRASFAVAMRTLEHLVVSDTCLGCLVGHTTCQVVQVVTLRCDMCDFPHLNAGLHPSGAKCWVPGPRPQAPGFSSRRECS